MHWTDPNIAAQIRAHRAALIGGTAITAAYTATVWWVCHPIIKYFERLWRRPCRWRVSFRRNPL